MKAVNWAKTFLSFAVFLLTCFHVKSQYIVPPAPHITDLKGAPCRENQTCHARDSNSYCKLSPDSSLESICHCDNGYVSSSDRSRCLAANVRLGGSCEENQQCSFWETSTAVCLTGSNICDCIPNYVPSDDLSKCLPVINILGTHSCLEDAQCQLGKPGMLSKCTKRSSTSSDDFKVCKCLKDTVNAAKDNKCHPVAEYPGDQCAIHAQCTAGLKHSRCIEKQCQCNRGYLSKENGGKRTCSQSSTTS